MNSVDNSEKRKQSVKGLEEGSSLDDSCKDNNADREYLPQVDILPSESVSLHLRVEFPSTI